MAFKDWSTTAANNDDADATINWLEGQAPSTVNDSARAMMAALAAWRDLTDYGTVSSGTVGGTANAITLTCSPTVSSHTAGARYLFKAASTNTGATTLTVDSITGAAIQYRGAALAGGEITSSDWVLVAFDGSVFQLLSPHPIRWAKGTLSGLTISRSDATTFGVAVGDCANEDSGARHNMSLTSAITKTLSAFSAGTGNGGLDTSSVGANTWYHVHLIRKDSDGTIDALYSTSVSSPTMPSGYTARRRIGSFKTNGSSQIIAFSQYKDEFLWNAAVIDVDDDNPTTSAVDRTLTVPTGLQVWAICSVGVWGGTTSALHAVVSAKDASDQASQTAATPLTGFPTSGATCNSSWMFATYNVRTDTSAVVRSRLDTSGANDRIAIITRGWIDPRGK